MNMKIRRCLITATKIQDRKRKHEREEKESVRLSKIYIYALTVRLIFSLSDNLFGDTTRLNKIK